MRMSGGRATKDVARVGDTVRRPVKPNSRLVRMLLSQLRERGFDAAPRYLGSDEHGREVFSFLPGEVPAELDPAIADATLIAAAGLIRRFHEATAGTEIAGDDEVVCHNDLSPCNFVFRDEEPVGIIDFDTAAPGQRLQDVGYALFLWLNLGTDGPPPDEQARRTKLFCRAYGIAANGGVIDAIVAAVAANIERLRADERGSDAEWWQAQLDWLNQHRGDLVERLALLAAVRLTGLFGRTGLVGIGAEDAAVTR
jgi:Ser/Thr protein kinase RdoA (MazF antagonist)